MFTKNVLYITIVSTLLAIGTHATAQTARNCGPRDSVVERLFEGYGEVRQFIALGSNNSLVETFASTETGTWTITVTTPEGTTCLVASGQSFEVTQDEAPVTGEQL